MPQGATRPQPQPDLLKRRGRAQALDCVPYDQLDHYRKVHYGKHVVGHPFNEVGQPRSGQGSPVISATTLVSNGATSYDMFIAGKLVAQAQGRDVYQYRSGANVVAKVTIVAGTHVEVSFFRCRQDDSGQYEFLTSFDEIPLVDAAAKVGTEWT